MVISGRLLSEGERVVVRTRTHAKALFGPVVVLLVVLGVAAYLSTLAHGVWLIVVWAVAVVLVVVFVLPPVLRWLGATYTVTDRRLITRTGVLTRRGHDIALNRISDASSERSITDRMFGCGTLVVADASTDGEVRLPDVPDVERVQLQLSDLRSALPPVEWRR
ncbi:MAG: PH domain-containing protein [Marmoricola sp.]